MAEHVVEDIKSLEVLDANNEFELRAENLATNQRQVDLRYYWNPRDICSMLVIVMSQASVYFGFSVPATAQSPSKGSETGTTVFQHL
jgi:hypothetical protein